MNKWRNQPFSKEITQGKKKNLKILIIPTMIQEANMQNIPS